MACVTYWCLDCDRYLDRHYLVCPKCGSENIGREWDEAQDWEDDR